MNEWARLVDRYASELKKYELVCSFCGQHLADNNINTDCHENSGGQTGIKQMTSGGGSRGGGQQMAPSDGAIVIYYTDEDPPAELIATKRHYFGRPSLKGYKQNPFRTQTAGLLKEEVIL